MKKSLIALAALAAASGAFAQQATAQAGGTSAVTLFGVLDATVTRLTVTDGGSMTIMDGGGRNMSSRLGFKGTEDLGGGLSAAFWLEAGINADNGTGSNTTANNTAAGDKIMLNQTTSPVVPTATLNARQGLTFNRASTISLISKTAGEVRLGRDYNPAFWNYTVYDVFGTVGAGSALNVIGGPLAPMGVQAFPPGAAYPMVRASNSVGWLSQDMGGFRAQLQYALSEQATVCASPESAVNGNTCSGASGDGRLFGGRLSYANGPLTAAWGYSKTNYGDVAAATAPTLAGTGTGTLLTSVANTMTTAAPFANTTAYRGAYTQNNLGASYDFGSFKLLGQWGTQKNAATTAYVERKLTNYGIGAVVPMGAWSFKASYNAAKRHDGAGATTEDGAKTSQYALGTQYDFSKRTAFYATYSSNKLTAGAATAGALRANLGLSGLALAANGSATATGLDVGLRHAF